MKIKSGGSFTNIGSSHDDCQDFAISGMINQTLGYAILADGCSQSHAQCSEVDFGARMLCYSARVVLTEMFKDRTTLNEAFTPEEIKSIGLKSIVMAEEHRKRFALHPSAIDATLLVCVSDGNRHNIVLFGDGGVVYRIGEKLVLNSVEFHSGAPFYLSYCLQDSKMQSYNDSVTDTLVEGTSLYINGQENPVKQTQQIIGPFNLDFYYRTSSSIVDPVSFVALTSDGVFSFVRPHAEYPDIICRLDAEKVIPDMFGFKNTHNGFVDRRMKRFLDDCSKTKTMHTDDISVAALSFQTTDTP